MNRSAPEGGYDFGPKRNYRRAVWGALRDIVTRTKKVEDAHVALMPSIEGKEIEVVEGFGFRRENMHVIDKNPAIVAHLTRRYPGINTYGVDLEAAAARMSRDGVILDAANFDLCGPATDALALTIVDLVLLFPQRHGAMAVTWLRGRESRASSKHWRQLVGELAGSRMVEDVFACMSRANVGSRALRRSDAARVCSSFLFASGLQSVTVTRCSAYKSTAGHQTMLWAVMDLGRPERIARIAADMSIDVVQEYSKLMRAAAKPLLDDGYAKQHARVTSMVGPMNETLTRLHEARRKALWVPPSGDDMKTKQTATYELDLKTVEEMHAHCERARRVLRGAMDARSAGTFHHPGFKWVAA